MKKIAVLLMLLPASAVLVGCGQIEETAGGIAGDAVTQVASAAAEEVQTRVCVLVEDGVVSVEDKKLLGDLVTAAGTAGLPAEITEPLAEIAAAGDQVPAESVDALRDACSTSS